MRRRPSGPTRTATLSPYRTLFRSCLQRVRADPDGYAALVARHGVLLDRIAALSGYDFYRSQAPLDPRAPIPMLSLAHRSEEHTSELQSLLRISYAVCCLKNKKKQYELHTITPNASSIRPSQT